jgi:hypothetical protein
MNENGNGVDEDKKTCLHDITLGFCIARRVLSLIFCKVSGEM